MSRTSVTRPPHKIPNPNTGGRPVALQVVAAEGYVEAMVAIDDTCLFITETMRALHQRRLRLIAARAEIQTGATAADALALSMVSRAA